MHNPESSAPEPSPNIPDTEYDERQGDSQPNVTDTVEYILNFTEHLKIAKTEEAGSDLSPLNNEHLLEHFENENTTPEEVNALLQALAEMSAQNDGYSGIIETMHHIHPSLLPKLRDDPSTPLDKIFADEINRIGDKNGSAYYKDIASIVEKTSKDQFGTAQTWRNTDETRPDYVYKLANMPQFPSWFIQHAIDQAREEGLSKPQEMMRLRTAEYGLIHDILKLPDTDNFARTMIRSLSERTMITNENEDGIVPISKGGGIDVNKWNIALSKIATRANLYTADELNRLYKTYNIADIDTLDTSSLEDMYDFMNDDEEVLSKIAKGELRVVEKDSISDYNGSLGQAASQLGIPEPGVTTLFFGLQEPSDIYRPFALLKSKHVKPSSVLMMTHGAPGYMTYGNTQIKATSWPTGGLSIAKSSINRIFDEYMQPHKTTGRRDVVLVSCRQGDEGPLGLIKTTAGALAAKSSIKDRVAVFAGSKNLSIHQNANSDPLEFYSDGVPAPTYAYQRRRRRRIGEAILGRRPLVRRKQVPHVMGENL